MATDARVSRLRARFSIAALAVGLAAPGCTPTPGAYCTSICAKLETCDSSTDELECRQFCETDQAYAPQYWQGLDACVSSLSCSDLSSELQDCLGDHARSVTPTPAVTSLCDTMASALRTCDESIDVSAAEEVCESIARLYSDSFATSLASCYAESCNNIERCLVDTADDYDVDNLFGVFSPASAPRGELTIAGLIRMLFPVYAEACACSGECTARGATEDQLACYDEEYRANPSLYQAAIACYRNAMNALAQCLGPATTMSECSACRTAYRQRTYDCPDLTPNVCDG